MICGSGPAKESSLEAAAVRATEQTKVDRSERARNAANQRHTKTRQLRKDNQQSVSESMRDKQGDEEGGRAKYREKNKLAAAKCRTKRNKSIRAINVRFRNFSAINLDLQAQAQELRDELIGLRTQALNHQNCNCQIARYNVNQAQKIALRADTSSLHTRCIERENPYLYSG